MPFDNNFRPLPIADLLDGNHHFIIPSFQRGYRWEEKQVLDLLEDIKQFSNDATKGNSYFLQPIVVKPSRENNLFAVLDGQQRLTTLLLILKRLMRHLGEDERGEYEDSLYDIKYANRPQLDFDNPIASDNIDSYYLSESKRVIDEWFTKQIKNKISLSKFRDVLLYNQDRQVKIIWYAIAEDSSDLMSINIFNRLNKGKIPLTSSELIKALFIMDYDLRSDSDKLAAEQLSMEWNEMERQFQNDNFWFFISDDQTTQTRIDVLFDFVTCRDEEKDTDYSYREFQLLYDFCREQERNNSYGRFDRPWATDIRNMQDAWRQIRKTFDRLLAWYEDNLYYHYVGYLVNTGSSPLQIHRFLEEKKTKKKMEMPYYEWTVNDTTIALRQMMMDKFKQGNRFIRKEEIDDFEYTNYDFVSRLLLLFNVETCRKGQCIRFAFDKFRGEHNHWDIEHVDSRNDSSLQEYDDRMRWLKNVNFILKKENPTDRSKELVLLSQELINRFETEKKVNKEVYNDFYITINRYYAAEEGEQEKDVNLATKQKDVISNLTLLDSSTNREYKDAPFAYKRYKIIQRDREGKTFIPVCTRNLFLKYYSDSNRESSHLDMMRWNSADRKGYLKAIHEAVDPIFDSVKETEENPNE